MNDVNILLEDAADLATQVAKAIDETGMVIIIGEPSSDNTKQSKHVGRMSIKSAIGIGETPTLWRKGSRPTCKQVTDRVAGLLQDFGIVGFQPLQVMRQVQVPDKKRQLYEIEIESEGVIQKTTG